MVTAAAGALRTDASAKASWNTPTADALQIQDFSFGGTSAMENAEDLPAAATIRRGLDATLPGYKAHPTTGMVLLGCSTEDTYL